LHASVASLAWTVLSSAVAIAIGIRRGSLVLVSFGATGVLDAVGSATLVAHFRHALHHQSVSERRERIALQVITIGLIVLGLLTAGESVRRLIEGAATEHAPEGIALASVSMIVLAALGSAKRRIGPRIPSPALVADGWVSTMGALLALVTVTGTAINDAVGWRWVDPAAALVIAIGAVAIAFELRRERDG
jgi:divalent metal cation (Fe/Co/Zn/Cd) transporter